MANDKVHDKGRCTECERYTDEKTASMLSIDGVCKKRGSVREMGWEGEEVDAEYNRQDRPGKEWVREKSEGMVVRVQV